MSTLLKILLWILLGLLVIISIHSIFTGGLSNAIAIIKADGFFEYIKQYFIEIWNGFKTTFGI